MVNPKDRNYVAVVVPLAAGVEPLNPALATAPPEAEPQGHSRGSRPTSPSSTTRWPSTTTRCPRAPSTSTSAPGRPTAGNFVQPAARARDDVRRRGAWELAGRAVGGARGWSSRGAQMRKLRRAALWAIAARRRSGSDRPRVVGARRPGARRLESRPSRRCCCAIAPGASSARSAERDSDDGAAAPSSATGRSRSCRRAWWRRRWRSRTAASGASRRRPARGRPGAVPEPADAGAHLRRLDPRHAGGAHAAPRRRAPTRARRSRR